jgi:hypothetical protein
MMNRNILEAFKAHVIVMFMVDIHFKCAVDLNNGFGYIMDFLLTSLNALVISLRFPNGRQPKKNERQHKKK